jgi:DNA-binding response OmpR family regulator
MPEGTARHPSTRLLIIDDDVELCELVSEYLRPEGFEIEAVHDGELGIKRVLSGEHALIVLDVMLPGLNGFEVLRRIRARSSTPVLMLTARGDDVDRIVGLEIGADDYLPKPFNPRELVARIHAILRRSSHAAGTAGTASSTGRLVVGDVELDPGSRTVRRGGEPVELTGVEFSLLEVLLLAAGRVVEREELSRTVLGRRLMPYDRSIDMHVSNLRKKLGHTSGQQDRIKAVRGFGYIYTLPGDASGKDDSTEGGQEVGPGQP